MKLYRVRHPTDGRPTLACREGEHYRCVPFGLPQLHHHVLDDGLPLNEQRRFIADEGAILAPFVGTKIVCVGLNYVHHAREMDKKVPEEPLLFMKPPSAVIGHGAPVLLPPQSQEVHHEGELALVIGETARDVDESEALDHVFGYTCANDVTARDIQRREKRYTRSKGFNTFCPLGPCVVTRDEFVPADHTVTCRVDGEVRQKHSLDDFIFGLAEVVSFVSRVMTLCPGDVVLTGTPMGVGSIEAGQTVEVQIDGIGTLSNPVENR